MARKKKYEKDNCKKTGLILTPTLPCMRCGKSARRLHIEPGTRIPPILCHRCIDAGEESNYTTIHAPVPKKSKKPPALFTRPKEVYIWPDHATLHEAHAAVDTCPLLKGLAVALNIKAETPAAIRLWNEQNWRHS